MSCVPGCRSSMAPRRHRAGVAACQEVGVAKPQRAPRRNGCVSKCRSGIAPETPRRSGCVSRCRNGTVLGGTALRVKMPEWQGPRGHRAGLAACQNAGVAGPQKAPRRSGCVSRCRIGTVPGSTAPERRRGKLPGWQGPEGTAPDWLRVKMPEWQTLECTAPEGLRAGMPEWQGPRMHRAG